MSGSEDIGWAGKKRRKKRDEFNVAPPPTPPLSLSSELGEAGNFKILLNWTIKCYITCNSNLNTDKTPHFKVILLSEHW